MKSILCCLLIISYSGLVTAQSSPIFGHEIPVTIIGLSHDAMEPFISPDGNALFFNSLNDGNTTSIYYAAKANDSTFNYRGALPVVNQPFTPRLDAVASMDINQNFYWISTRGYPSNIENLHHVTFENSSYSNFGRVHGNFYINSPGWIIMDATIDLSGNFLYYCNAHFSTCNALPCFSKIGIAQKENDSTFLKIPGSTSLLSNVNDTLNYIIYAPAISADGLELYYTRALINTFKTEIVVAVRNDVTLPFGFPQIIDNTSDIPEGPTLTTDKQKLYYHKRTKDGYRIFMRYRVPLTGGLKIQEENTRTIQLSPNPATGQLKIHTSGGFRNDEFIEISTLSGKIILSLPVSEGNKEYRIDTSGMSDGLYIFRLGAFRTRFVINGLDK